jgi:hypothetical protein
MTFEDELRPCRETCSGWTQGRESGRNEVANAVLDFLDLSGLGISDAAKLRKVRQIVKDLTPPTHSRQSLDYD